MYVALECSGPARSTRRRAHSATWAGLRVGSPRTEPTCSRGKYDIGSVWVQEGEYE